MGGQIALRIGDQSNQYGFAVSVGLHGALLAVLALMPSPRAGTATQQARGVLQFDVQMVSSADASGAAVAAPAASRSDAGGDQMAAAAKPTGQTLPSPQATAIGSSGGVPLDGQQAGNVAAAQQFAAYDGAVRSSYQSALFAHVLRYRYYPEAARPDRLHGIVRIQFAIARDGRILTAWIEQSSGYAVLDAAALDALRRAEPLPAIPAELPGEMEVLLPIDYVPPKVVRAS